MFTPVRTRRTFEEAAEQIADKVRAGELRVGDKLPAERDLALQMEISRPTLREAVRVLVEAGLLEVRRGPGGGMFVATDVVPVDLVRRAFELQLEEATAVLEARRLIEPQVARLAHERASEEDLAPLEHTIEVMRGIMGRGYRPEDEDRFLQLDVQFHLALARAAGNQTLETLLRIVFRQLEVLRDMAMHVPTVPEWIIDVHERTLEAVRSGEGLDEVMDEHLGALEDTLQSV